MLKTIGGDSVKTQQLKNEIKEIISFIIDFYKDPFKTVKSVPSWSWKSLFTLIFTFAALTGLLRGLISASLLQIFIGVVFLPISTALSIVFIAGILYHSIALTHKRHLNFKRLCNLIFIILIPSLTTYALAFFHPAILLIGASMSFLLLAIGLLKRFQLRRKFVQFFVGFFYGLFILAWLGQYFDIKSNSKTREFIKMNEKNQEILQEEFINK